MVYLYKLLKTMYHVLIFFYKYLGLTINNELHKRNLICKMKKCKNLYHWILHVNFLLKKGSYKYFRKNKC